MRIKYTAITTCKVELFYFDLFFKPFMGFHFVLVTVSIGVCPIKTTLVSPIAIPWHLLSAVKSVNFVGLLDLHEEPKPYTAAIGNEIYNLQLHLTLY